MSVIERTSCRACGGLLETVHDFGEVPVINFGQDRPDLKAPLELTLCQSCHLLQLRQTVDPKLLFSTYFYRSSQNDTMRAHLRGIVEEVQKRVALKEGDVVVDIGSNDATLLNFYPESVFTVGFEPSELANQHTVPNGVIVNAFFSADDYFPHPKFDKMGVVSKAKAITAIGMFYDVNEPNAFLKDVKEVLAPDGLFVIEQAYLPEMLRTNNITNVVHEHLCYYSLHTLDALLEHNDLQMLNVEFFPINGGVFRCYIRHRGAGMSKGLQMGYQPELWTAEREQNLDKMQTYTDFVARVFQQAAKLHEFVEAKTIPIIHNQFVQTVDIYGPSTRGLMLLQVAGLTAKHFRYAVDRDPSKVGKTYMGVPVVSEEQMRAEPPDYLLVLPMGFLAEMVQREFETLKKGTKMVIPLPAPYVIGVEML